MEEIVDVPSEPPAAAGEPEEAASGPLLPTSNSDARRMAHACDDHCRFRSWLRWMWDTACTGASRFAVALRAAFSWTSWFVSKLLAVAWRFVLKLLAVASWFVFPLLDVAVPVAALVVVALRRGPYDVQVQVSLMLAGLLSYATLSFFVRRLGLRRLIYLHRPHHDSEDVRNTYKARLAWSYFLLVFFVLLCLVDAGNKVYWYVKNPPFPLWWWSVAACALEIASWTYRVGMFFRVCMQFRLKCYLLILRMERFERKFGQSTDAARVVRKHRRIRGRLRWTSHHYRIFIVSCLFLVTVSLLYALLDVTRPPHAQVSSSAPTSSGEARAPSASPPDPPLAQVNIATNVELLLCSLSLVTGLFICLHSAAKITHKTQTITGVAAQWHAEATINAHLDEQASSSQVDSMSSDEESDEDWSGSEDIPSRFTSLHESCTFEKRQALVTYMENNRTGITLYGFTLDRQWLHALFMIFFSLASWLLGKTVAIS